MLLHCGSHAPLPTLKPHLTVLAPRLGTDCLLNFIREGVSPYYIFGAELALHQYYGLNCLHLSQHVDLSPKTR